MEVLRRLTAGDGTFIDAGANFGVYSLAVSHSSVGEVIAIEPQTHLAEAIRRSAAANGFENLARWQDGARRGDRLRDVASSAGRVGGGVHREARRRPNGRTHRRRRDDARSALATTSASCAFNV